MPHSQSNRLAKETSPYLLQHQHNPVDWYAWGPEAFAAVREQNKPIFLSVGYSTCYWCHVMERQSFENAAIAAEMNQRFINIKVDREERADVDQLYMTAVQVLTRQGGWPMSVFMLPDLRPFYGGTYFPPADGHGRPGFPTLLRALEDAYKNCRADVEKTADQLVNILRQLAEPTAPSSSLTIDTKFIDGLIARSLSDYDVDFGGFGRAPKFPRQTLLELLLQSPSSKHSRLLRHTLDAMANGGIRDHLGGGFHRYSTDAEWLVPHFEIMLYDNAMLAWIYVEAFKQFHEPRYERIARGILDFVLRDMTDPSGAFYTAFDAEVDAQEGMPYLWTADEIQDYLGDADAEKFGRVYGLDGGPNFADPHHGNGTPEKNILYLPDGPASENDPVIIAMREKLLAARKTRKQPLLDTKILTSWNALMIRAFAHAGEILGDDRYLKAANAAADFLLAHHRTADGGLYRTSRGGPAKYSGFLDDYAFLVQALLSLKRTDQARELATVMRSRFGDEKTGGFFFTDDRSEELIVRQKTASDSPLPSGNGVAAMALLELGEAEDTRRTLTVFAGQLQGQAESMSALVQAAGMYLKKHAPIEVAGSSEVHVLSPQEIAADVVKTRIAWTDPSTLVVRLEIRDGFHINAHVAGKNLIGTELTLSEPARIDYPKGDEIKLAFADEPMRVYQKSVEIIAHFPNSMAESEVIPLALRYQACDESACLTPVVKRFEVPPPS